MIQISGERKHITADLQNTKMVEIDRFEDPKLTEHVKSVKAYIDKLTSALNGIVIAGLKGHIKIEGARYAYDLYLAQERNKQPYGIKLILSRLVSGDDGKTYAEIHKIHMLNQNYTNYSSEDRCRGRAPFFHGVEYYPYNHSGQLDRYGLQRYYKRPIFPGREDFPVCISETKLPAPAFPMFQSANEKDLDTLINAILSYTTASPGSKATCTTFETSDVDLIYIVNKFLELAPNAEEFNSMPLEKQKILLRNFSFNTAEAENLSGTVTINFYPECDNSVVPNLSFEFPTDINGQNKIKHTVHFYPKNDGAIYFYHLGNELTRRKGFSHPECLLNRFPPSLYECFTGSTAKLDWSESTLKLFLIALTERYAEHQSKILI